jgi:hypothetical protein
VARAAESVGTACHCTSAAFSSPERAGAAHAQRLGKAEYDVEAAPGRANLPE